MKSFRFCSFLGSALTVATIAALASCDTPSKSGGLFGPEPPRTVSFEREIRPLLESRCLSCHHSGRAMRNLNLETRKLADTSWRGGPVIVPKYPERSMLLQILELDTSGEAGNEPGHSIDFATREKIITWIREGAEWPTTATPLQPR